MKPKQDPDNTELTSILDNLLTQRVAITVREVTRCHSTLKNPSAFTRDITRMELIDQYQKLQRKIDKKIASDKDSDIKANDNDAKDELIAELGRQRQALIDSHIACISAVMKAGGMAGLERFWLDYKEIGDVINKIVPPPTSAKVVRLKRKSKIKT